MPIQVTIAEIQMLRQDTMEVLGFIKDQPGKHKETEAAAKRMEEFAEKLMGMDVQIQI